MFQQKPPILNFEFLDDSCIQKTAALPQDEETESEDPFTDIEEEDMSSLDELVCQINPDASASDYIDADEDLSTSFVVI